LDITVFCKKSAGADSFDVAKKRGSVFQVQLTVRDWPSLFSDDVFLLRQAHRHDMRYFVVLPYSACNLAYRKVLAKFRTQVD
jgi:hypothetical protein